MNSFYMRVKQLIITYHVIFIIIINSLHKVSHRRSESIQTTLTWSTSERVTANETADRESMFLFEGAACRSALH